MRRKNDFYPTPEWATRELLRYVPCIRGTIFEPCIGDGAIARVLDGDERTVYGNDIAPLLSCSFCGDATTQSLWQTVEGSIFERIDWTVTNPPFNVAPEIVPLAHEFSFEGVAMLLRLSYLEPTEDRGGWLNAHPPTKLIVLPRISFTGDGKTDLVTCAWMVWNKSPLAVPEIIIAENPKFIAVEPIAQSGLFATVGE